MFERAKKSLGQNFLADERVVERIVGEFAPRAWETVMEIGPGRGALTGALVERAGRVVAVEFDSALAEHLRARFGGRESFVLIEADALEVDFCEAIAPASSARVVANLPYNVSTAILQRLIAQRLCVTEMVLMLQREVVERITAPPSSSARGYLSVLVEAYCESEPLLDVAPGSFRPVPKVWSTVVRLRVRERAELAAIDEPLLWRVVGAGFAQRRKTIYNNLRGAPEELRARVETVGGAGALLEAAGVEPSRRAETLALDEWLRLAAALSPKSETRQS
ncbi:MAG TPA: 16S rRNA (adenine(1518)-N(6)/adenine(1519)-N(6))-dimethyltransferase RsmA [Pyrinomonadaceae bacterium]|nr:16S rRNA (adenine(1518)-N(6)/adenine(1519)-N(6))-dimethyltransferase RsmA [Pyrinomonadaceae bacterium]